MTGLCESQIMPWKGVGVGNIISRNGSLDRVRDRFHTWLQR